MKRKIIIFIASFAVLCVASAAYIIFGNDKLENDDGSSGEPSSAITEVPQGDFEPNEAPTPELKEDTPIESDDISSAVDDSQGTGSSASDMTSSDEATKSQSQVEKITTGITPESSAKTTTQPVSTAATAKQTTTSATTKTTSKVTTEQPTSTAPATVTTTTTPATVTTTPETTATAPTTTPPATTEASDSSSFISEVIRLVNIERANVGVPALSESSALAAAASIRAEEIAELFSHTRPNGESCFTVLAEVGYSYRATGENIAWGQKTPEEVMQSWMNSAGHKANILSENFTEIGVGYNPSKRGWVQMFGTPW